MKLSFIREHRRPAILLLFFGIFYISLFACNHWHFGTSGFDLGIFQQTLYHYAHGTLGPNTIRQVPNLLADHLELLLFLISPFWWVFHGWTLIILQVIAVLIGASGIYLLVQDPDNATSKPYAILSMLFFLIQWPLLQALSFDYHNNVLITMFIPWLFYFAQEKKWLHLYLGSLLFLGTKETASLLLVALGIGLLFSRKSYKHGALLILMGVFWFFISIQVLIPFFGDGTYPHWSYQALGPSGSKALLFVLKHPLDTLQLLFDKKVKREFWFYFLVSGGILLIRWPRLGLCALPIIGMKMFSSNANYWGTVFHYNMELAPLVAIATGWTCLHLSKPWNKLLFSTLFSCNLFIVWTLPLHNSLSAPAFIQKSFSPLTPLQKNVYKAMKLIPPIASVSTQNEFVAHLSARPQIYLLPEYKEAEYILLNSHTHSSFPFLSRRKMKKFLTKFQKNTDYAIIFKSKNIVLYKKQQIK